MIGRWLLVGAVAVLGLASAQQRGGTITIAIQTEPAAWDPTQVAGADISRVVYDNVLQGLVKRNPKGEIVPSLASRWVASNSGLTYTFTLRSGVKFHNGSDFTSADVVAKFNRARNPDTRASGHLRPDLYRDIISVTAPSATSVVFNLRQPNNDFLFTLSRPESLILPSDAKLEELRAKPVGTGPFVFSAWEKGVAVRLARNPNYYVQGQPLLDGVNFRFLGDGDAQLAGLRAGDIDVIAYSLLPENALVLQRDTANFKVFSGSGTAEAVAGFNNSRAPFNDVRVRRAITLATNKDELIKGAMLGYGAKIGSMRSPGEACYVDLSNFAPYNPDQAKALLAEAGFTAEKPLTFTYTVAAEFPYERRIGEAMAAQLNALGPMVKVNIQVVDFNTWIQRVFTQADYGMTIIGHVEANDTSNYANPRYYWRYDSQRFRDFYTQYLRAPNQTRACAALGEAQRVLAQDYAGVWTMSLPALGAYRARIQNWPEGNLSPGIVVSGVSVSR
ncbi:MAG: ABC transporter substrate-binding protein [Meiothermus sp.]|nr:ABC transporter substrate-binding protein [Meiothermus sp.]